MSLIDFQFLFQPVEQLDAWLTGLFDGASLLVALGIAFVLGVRHASDPDHLVAVTSLMAGDDADSRGAVRLGAWWGLGHATTLLVIGLPLIAFKSELPSWLETGAERAVGVLPGKEPVRAAPPRLHEGLEPRRIDGGSCAGFDRHLSSPRFQAPVGTAESWRAASASSTMSKTECVGL